MFVDEGNKLSSNVRSDISAIGWVKLSYVPWAFPSLTGCCSRMVIGKVFDVTGKPAFCKSVVVYGGRFDECGMVGG